MVTLSQNHHKSSRWLRQEALRNNVRLILEPVSPPPPPGYVRVHFHSHLYQIYDRSPPDLTADVPLCRSGGLDLDVVMKRRWGLETCLPVDPLRWKPFEPSHPNYLSPVAIRSSVLRPGLCQVHRH
ncbi:hypothetical protein B0H14DRAFT_1355986 [Mycena olivaceomarginata]|nr:hypothetical protein B0H14DRAFT_1355986 [Mycena olivaceomarginata]